MNCGGGQTMNTRPDPANPMPASQNATVGCSLCTPGVTDAARGCP